MLSLYGAHGVHLVSSSSPHARILASARRYLRFNKGVWKHLFVVSVTGLLALALFEEPTYEGWQLPVWLTTTVECIFLALLAVRTAMLYRFVPASRYWSDPKIIAMYIALTVRSF